jgi:hypothetical protein
MNTNTGVGARAVPTGGKMAGDLLDDWIPAWEEEEIWKNIYFL